MCHWKCIICYHPSCCRLFRKHVKYITWLIRSCSWIEIWGSRAILFFFSTLRLSIWYWFTVTRNESTPMALHLWNFHVIWKTPINIKKLALFHSPDYQVLLFPLCHYDWCRVLLGSLDCSNPLAWRYDYSMIKKIEIISFILLW